MLQPQQRGASYGSIVLVIKHAHTRAHSWCFTRPLLLALLCSIVLIFRCYLLLRLLAVCQQHLHQQHWIALFDDLVASFGLGCFHSHLCEFVILHLHHMYAG